MRFSGGFLHPTLRNSPSAVRNPDIVEKIIQKELDRGSSVGPFTTPPLPNLHTSRFSIAEKPDKSGWRFLFDLSHPPNFSVNAGIKKSDATVSYVKVRDLCAKILDVGRGASLCKFDIKAAYRHVPVYPDDRYLLRFTWKNSYYLDMALPMGCRSSCVIFNEVGDLFTEIFNHEALILFFVHYLDDFAGVAPPEDPANPSVTWDFRRILALCEKLGIPLAKEKTAFPSTSMVFLGFLLNTEDLTICLPEEKVKAYLEAVSWALCDILT